MLWNTEQEGGLRGQKHRGPQGTEAQDKGGEPVMPSSNRRGNRWRGPCGARTVLFRGAMPFSELSAFSNGGHSQLV